MENYSDIFVDDVRNSIIFHIPHSGLEIPFYDGFVSSSVVENEIALLTDHYTDKIFDVTGIDSLVFPYNRVFCDVERLNDADEVMFEKGRGFFYTKTDSGSELRTDVNGIKDKIYKDYYLKHHSKLKDKVQSKLDLDVKVESLNQ
jgi:N-formylglutamate amidohydrolase